MLVAAACQPPDSIPLREGRSCTTIVMDSSRCDVYTSIREWGSEGLLRRSPLCSQATSHTARGRHQRRARPITRTSSTCKSLLGTIPAHLRTNREGTLDMKQFSRAAVLALACFVTCASAAEYPT